MEIAFKYKEERMLFETGQATGRLRGLQAQDIKRFIDAVNKLHFIETAYQLWHEHPAMRFKKYEDHYSVRVSGSYRLELDLIFEADSDSSPVHCLILNLSKHYGD